MKNLNPRQSRRGLRIHAICFLIVLPLLVVLNLWIGHPWWVQWVVLGWGVGLVSHWLSVRKMLKAADVLGGNA
jgi:hypothetical protein